MSKWKTEGRWSFIRVGPLTGLVIHWESAHGEEEVWEWFLCPDNEDKCEERAYVSGKEKSALYARNALQVAVGRLAVEMAGVSFLLEELKKS